MQPRLTFTLSETLKDPNKPVMRLYTIPQDAFVELESEENDA